MSEFAVGDLCDIICDMSGRMGHLVGLQCTIIEPLDERYCLHDGILLTYVGQCTDGRSYLFRPPELRKVTPPPQRQEIGEWELCPWRPTETERVT